MKTFTRYLLQTIGALTVMTCVIGLGAMTFAGYWMRVDDEPVKADYILPLAGDRSRLIKAAELFREGYAPTILISNARVRPPSRLQKLHWQMGYPKYSKAQYLDLLMKKLGASSAKLEEFGNGHTSTVEEAEALRMFLGGKPTTLLIATSPYHAKRAKMIFEDILSNCTIVVTTTQENGFKRWWWQDQDSAQLLTLEFAKTIHYLMGGAFRSSDIQPAN